MDSNCLNVTEEVSDLLYNQIHNIVINHIEQGKLTPIQVYNTVRFIYQEMGRDLDGMQQQC